MLVDVAMINRSVSAELSSQYWPVCHVHKSWELNGEDFAPPTAEGYNGRWGYSFWSLNRPFKSCDRQWVNGRYEQSNPTTDSSDSRVVVEIMLEVVGVLVVVPEVMTVDKTIAVVALVLIAMVVE